MKLSVYVEKVKNAEKQARPIGTNKPAVQTKQKGADQKKSAKGSLF